MKKRKLGCSDLWISEIGLGCMTIGTTPQLVNTLLEKAIDSGINFIDTADLYDYGLNEELVGEAIKPFRQKLILSTKGGNQWNATEQNWKWNPSKAYLKEAVKNSLRRLQTDYIDLYQLHGGTIEDNIDETIEAFEELVTEGVIRYYGISSMRPNVIRTYAEKSNIVSVMMPYSILDRRSEEWFSYLKDQNLSVLARGTLAKGLLTDTFKTRIKQDYLSYSKEELLLFLTTLSEQKPIHSIESYALAFALKEEQVSSVVAGMRTLAQLEHVLKGYHQSIPPHVLMALCEQTKLETFQQHR